MFVKLVIFLDVLYTFVVQGLIQLMLSSRNDASALTAPPSKNPSYGSQTRLTSKRHSKQTSVLRTNPSIPD